MYHIQDLNLLSVRITNNCGTSARGLYLVERLGIEPRLTVLQTIVQTHYTISRDYLFWVRWWELNPPAELMRLGASPDAHRIKG